MELKSIIKISGISGILLPIVFILGLMLSILEAPWFRWTDNAISDLGRSEFGIPLFNYTLISIGILLFLFSVGLYYSLKSERMGPTALALSSIYFVGVGACPLPNQIHIDISGLFFIAFPLGFFILGLNMYKNQYHFIKNMGIIALTIAIISGVSPIFLLFFNGIAIPEIIIIIPGLLWCMRYGLNLILPDGFSNSKNIQ